MQAQTLCLSYPKDASDASDLLRWADDGGAPGPESGHHVSGAEPTIFNDLGELHAREEGEAMTDLIAHLVAPDLTGRPPRRVWKRT